MPIMKDGYSLHHIFKIFRKKTKIKVSRRMFLDICYEYNKLLVQDILNGSYEKLHPVGDFLIRKYEINYENPRIDFYSTKKEGQVIYFLNNRTDNFYFRFLWKKIKHNKRFDPNSAVYSFRPSKYNAEELSHRLQTVPNGHKKYIEHFK